MPVSYDEYIKQPGLEIEFTGKMLQDLKRCSEDFFYFCENFVKIIHPDEGRIIFKLRDYQRKALEIILNNRFTICLWCRQAGKTTMISSYVVWLAIFHSDKQIGIVSNKASSAKDVLERIRIIYEELPIWLKPGVQSYAATSIKFENNSKIFISATSKSAFRGRTLNLLVSDELASVPPTQCEDFWAANYPTISASKESKIIVISTPEGLFNLFHRLWIGAINKKNSFIPHKVTWRDVPGRDEKWAQEEILNLDPIKFKQEHECEFIGSSTTLINASTLEVLLKQWKNPIRHELNDSFVIYEDPQENYQYVIGIDVAKGTGGDFSVAQVLKISNLNPIQLEQVAVYRNNIIDSYSFAEIVNRIALHYNNAYLMIENNDEGSVVVNRIWWEYENMNLVNYTTSRSKRELGIRATKKTKPQACMLLKRLVEYNNLKLYDKQTIEELASFVEEKGKMFGKTLHDDCVTSLFWACFILETNILNNETKFDNKNKFIDEDGWGILADYETLDDDWEWLSEISL